MTLGREGRPAESGTGNNQMEEQDAGETFQARLSFGGREQSRGDNAVKYDAVKGYEETQLGADSKSKACRVRLPGSRQR